MYLGQRYCGGDSCSVALIAHIYCMLYIEYLTQNFQIERHFQFCLCVIMVWDLALVQPRVVQIRVYYL